jgi:endonuclease/exonuclease/phosphatase family metal-dependent hydrolase
MLAFRPRLLSASLVAAVVVRAASLDPPSIPLDVMTFNIRTSYVDDGDNAWPLRKALVAETIGRFAPQVAGLQEVLNEQIEYLASALPEYRWLGVDRGLNGGQGLSEYAPIFYRYSELSPIESGTFWLSTPPGGPTGPSANGRGARIVTWARFHHLATGREIYVFNTHFTLRQGQVQVDSAKMIEARVASLTIGTPVLVIGDFNSNAEDSDAWKELTAHGLADAWTVAHERRGPALTMSDFGPPPEGKLGRIDWILVSGPVEVRSAETVLHNDKGRYPSDHYPVVARLTVR